MMRRNPTVLSITAEDIADYEDRRTAELRDLEATAQTRVAADPRRLPAQGAWAYDDSSSDDPPYGREDDEDEDDDDDHDEHARRNREQMDIDAEPPLRPHAAVAEEPSSPTGAYAASRQARGGRARTAAHHVQARTARLQENAGPLGRTGPGGRGGDGPLAMAAATTGQQQQQQQRPRLGNPGRPAAAGAPPQGGIVTPEARAARTRDERIGVAPERRRR